jgi:hypothetical protein
MGSSWDAWILGIIGALLALWALGAPASSNVAEWIVVVLGIVLFISPWVFGFATLAAAAWAAWIIGILFIIAAAWTLMATRSTGTGAAA